MAKTPFEEDNQPKEGHTVEPSVFLLEPPDTPMLKNLKSYLNQSIARGDTMELPSLENHKNGVSINKQLKTEKDVLSSAYEYLVEKEDRRSLAQFFTHKELVRFILSHIPINGQSLILDPACGAGAFLIEAYNEVRNLDNIFGIDIDETAVQLSKLNIQLIAQKVPKNIKLANTLKCDILQVFPDVKRNGGFDIVVGNPPFQNLEQDVGYYKSESIYSQVLNGIANSATLMIAKGFECLKEGGYLGFVLPKNMMRVKSFEKLRNFIINNTKLIYIYDLDHYFKDVRGDQIILIFQKKKLESDEFKKHKTTFLIYRKGSDFSHPYKYEVPQSEFLKYDFFPVFYDNSIFPFADLLLKLKPTLNDVCDGNIFRGLNLGANSELISKNSSGSSRVIFRGDSIRRFGIKYPLYIDITKLNGLEKNKIKRLQTNKIILQNICSKEGGIFAALSNPDELSLDTVTNIVSTKLNLKYLVGVLNSKITNLFIILIVFLNSNFTMHTDREYIGRIPIILPTAEQEKLVIEIVERILKMKDYYSKEFFDEYKELNNVLFDIYGFNQSQKESINEMLNVNMSRKQNGKQNE